MNQLFKEKFACVLVQRRRRVWVNEQALDDGEHVLQRVLGCPIPFEGVDTNVTRLGHVGVEDLGQEVPLWWRLRKL